MNFKYLKDSDLLDKTKTLVKQESDLTLEILYLLREIEFRKLFLSRGFASLFEYCVKGLGYSESAANRRISSMRLLRQIPEAQEKLKENKVNLSTLTLLQSHIKREEKVREVAREEKLGLLSQIEGLSQEACQKVLLGASSLPHLAEERERIISETLTEIRFVAGEELMAKFKELKGLLAHKNHDFSWNEFFDLLSSMALKKLRPEEKAKKSQKPVKTDTPKVADENPTAVAVVPFATDNQITKIKRNRQKNSRYVPQDLKRKIWKRDQGCCQYIDPITKRKCESRRALEYDHVWPFALSGKTTEDNLRLLCRAHNALRAEELFGPYQAAKRQGDGRHALREKLINLGD